MRRFLAAGVAAGVLALAASGCGATSDGGSGSSAPCMVLANGGNRVCGADAAAWCRATDGIRQGATDPTLQQTQSDCDMIEAQYSSNQ